MSTVGYMTMPEGFKYRDVFLRGKPQHDKFDKFSVKHPPMDVGKRAKIFSPFDALKGFNEAVAAKEILYVCQKELSDEDKVKLNRQLNVLHNLTYNSRVARQNLVKVTVTYFEPCSDANSNAFGTMGLYKTVSGVCWKVDADENREMIIDCRAVQIEKICRIEEMIVVENMSTTS